MYNVVEVEFCKSDRDYQNPKKYSYYSDIDLKAGDICVVQVRDNEYYTVKVVGARGLSRAARDRATKWIVCKVDTDAYIKSLKSKELILEIKNKLRERKEQAEEMLIYQQLASTDPEIKALLEELRILAPNMVPQIEEVTNESK